MSVDYSPVALVRGLVLEDQGGVIGLRDPGGGGGLTERGDTGRSEDLGGTGGKEDPGEAGGEEGQGTVGGPDVCSETRETRDQGGTGGTREPGGALVMADNGGARLKLVVCGGCWLRFKLRSGHWRHHWNRCGRSLGRTRTLRAGTKGFLWSGQRDGCWRC